MFTEVLYKALIKLLCVGKDGVGSNGSLRPREVLFKLFEAFQRDVFGFVLNFCLDFVVATPQEAIKWELAPDINPFIPGIAWFDLRIFK